MVIPAISNANFVITEIMYDVSGTDTDREWIEVKNEGSTPLDLSLYKFFEANTNHSLVISQGNQSIPAGGFAVIADKPANFLVDNPSFSGALFDSSFSLSNSGEELSIKDAEGNITDAVAYDPSIGANGDGNSLQKTESGWKALASTPGKEAGGTSSNTQSAENTSTSTNTTTQQTQTVVSTHYVASEIAIQPTTKEEEGYFSVSAGRNRLSSAGSPVQFSADLKTNGTLLNGIEYKWYLGDGFIAYGKTIEHIYAFSGDYVVILSASGYGRNSVHRINVKVVEPKLSARHIDGGIEIKNDGKEEINLFKWSVSVANQNYDVLGDLIVMPGKLLALDSRITKLPNYGNITLTSAIGKTVSLAPSLKSQNLLVQGSAPNSTAKKEPQSNTENPKNTAAVSQALVIEHQSALKKLGEFLKKLFSSQ